jgi:hypothetical protein
VTATDPVIVVEAKLVTHGEVPWLTVTVPETGTVPEIDTGCTVVPVGSIRIGFAGVPSIFVPFVISTGHEFAIVFGLP